MLKEVIHNNNNEFLSKKLQSGIIIWALSDGYYHPTYQYRTSAWIIKIQNKYHAIIEADIVPGDAKYQCSRRSELCGLIGDIRHINNIFITYKFLEGSSELRCDGLEAYKLVTRHAYSPYTKLSHYDLSSTLHQLIKSIPLYWKFRHLKGHQDYGDTYNKIDEWRQINIEADRLAKYCMW